MTRVLKENPCHPAFKFEQSFKLDIFTSLFLSILIFVGIIGFTVTNLKSSVQTLTYSGLLMRESDNSSFLVVVLPTPQVSQLSYHVLIDLQSSFPDRFYSVEAHMFCQWYDLPARVIRQTLPNVTDGQHRLFSTSVTSYSSLLIQIHVTDLFGGGVDSLRVVTVQNESTFGAKAIRVRIVLSLTSVVLTVIYALSLSALRNPVRPQQIMTLIAVCIGAIANFPFVILSDRLIVTVIESIFCGGFCSFNLICLFCFLQPTPTQDLHFVLPISSLFLIAQSMAVVTSDTTILSHYFENNNVVSVFFLSITVLSTTGYAAILVKNLLAALCRSRTTRKHLFLAYGVAVCFALGPLVGEAVLFVVTECGNSAVDFCVHYLTQTLLTFLYADLHWPLCPGLDEDQYILKDNAGGEDVSDDIL
jgi:hypothetical protein